MCQNVNCENHVDCSRVEKRLKKTKTECIGRKLRESARRKILPTDSEVAKIIEFHPKSTTKKSTATTKKDIQTSGFFGKLMVKKGRKFLPDQKEIAELIEG